MKCSQKIAALYRQQLLRLLLHKRLTLDENNQIYAFTISYFFHSFLSHRARYFCHCNSYVEDERDSSFENREEKCYFKMFVVVFVEFKKGFELWDRESVKQDPFSPPLFALFRDLAGREELYIPYLQHFEPSLLSVNWFQTLSPNGISGISIRSHLVKPGHKTRGPVCYLDTYIYCRHVLTHKNQFMRFAFASNCDKFFRPAIIIIPALRHLFSSLWNRIKCWIHAIIANFNRKNPFFRSSCNS